MVSTHSRFLLIKFSLKIGLLQLSVVPQPSHFKIPPASSNFNQIYAFYFQLELFSRKKTLDSSFFSQLRKVPKCVSKTSLPI